MKIFDKFKIVIYSIFHICPCIDKKIIYEYKELKNSKESYYNIFKIIMNAYKKGERIHIGIDYFPYIKYKDIKLIFIPDGTDKIISIELIKNLKDI